MITSEAIKERAHILGFDLCGVAPASGFPELRYFREWIARGHAGTMGYLPRTAERRADVRRVVPGARAVVMVGLVYNDRQPYSTERNDSSAAEVARYARGADYHDVMGERLAALLEWMRTEQGEPFEARAYVDTGPVQERVYAQYAGIGWIGKNTCLINPEAGSWLLLGAIVCSLALAPDDPGFDRCGTCTLCLEACPTSAFVAPYELDARRCISYLTIEYRGVVPADLREGIGNHVFGCDVCQEVCPWNAAPVRAAGGSWAARRSMTGPSLVDLWRRSDAELEAFIADTPLSRAGVRGLRRNLAIALGNSRTPEALDALDGAPDDGTFADPVVREHIEWAKGRRGV